MSLHDEIMNIKKFEALQQSLNETQRGFFDVGFEEAQRAAAKLAIASDARIEALEQDNASLREQNRALDSKCAKLELMICQRYYEGSISADESSSISTKEQP